MTSARAPGRIKVVDATFTSSATAPSQYPRQALPEVAVLGRSNVGKSSLLNFMTSRHRLARVSNTPGRTRLVNFFDVRLEAGVDKRALFLVDLPGYGFAKLSHVEKAQVSEMLGRYLEAPRPLRAACLLLDIRREPAELDRTTLEQLRSRGVPVILVVTKADKVGKNQRIAHVASVARGLGVARSDVVVTSVLESLGREELLSLLWSWTAPLAETP